MKGFARRLNSRGKIVHLFSKLERGELWVDADGAGLRRINPKNLRECCGYVTEARHDDSLFLPWPVWRNVVGPKVN